MSFVVLRGDTWHWRETINKKIYSRSTRHTDKKLAEAQAALWRAEAIKAANGQGTLPVQLKAAVRGFLAERDGTTGGVNAETHLRHFLKLGPNLLMHELTVEQVQGVVNKRRASGIAHNTLVVMVGYWNAVCNWCEENKMSGGPKLPRMKTKETKDRVLTYEEEDRFLAALGPDVQYPGKCPKSDKDRETNLHLTIALMDTGSRYNEIARMTWDQVDLERGTIYIKRLKNGISNTLIMSNRLRAVMAQRKAEATSHYVFPTKVKWNDNTSWVRNTLKRAGISEAGGKITLHSFRHQFCSRMVQNGMPLLELKTTVGHRELQSTVRYAHQEQGANVLRAVAILNARPVPLLPA